MVLGGDPLALGVVRSLGRRNIAVITLLGDYKIAAPSTPLDVQGNPLYTTYTGQLFGVGDLLADYFRDSGFRYLPAGEDIE